MVVVVSGGWVVVVVGGAWVVVVVVTGDGVVVVVVTTGRRVVVVVETTGIVWLRIAEKAAKGKMPPGGGVFGVSTTATLPGPAGSAVGVPARRVVAVGLIT